MKRIYSSIRVIVIYLFFTQSLYSQKSFDSLSMEIKMYLEEIVDSTNVSLFNNCKSIFIVFNSIDKVSDSKILFSNNITPDNFDTLNIEAGIIDTFDIAELDIEEISFKSLKLQNYKSFELKYSLQNNTNDIAPFDKCSGIVEKLSFRPGSTQFEISALEDDLSQLTNNKDLIGNYTKIFLEHKYLECSDTIDHEITISKLKVNIADSSDIICETPGEIVLSIDSVNIIGMEWDFRGGEQSNDNDATIKFSKEGDYSIIASNSLCADTVQFYIDSIKNEEPQFNEILEDNSKDLTCISSSKLIVELKDTINYNFSTESELTLNSENGPGVYTLEIEDNDKCVFSYETELEDKKDELPKIEPNIINDICEQGGAIVIDSIDLSLFEEVKIYNSEGVSLNDYVNLESGGYTIIYSDGQLCVDSVNVTIDKSEVQYIDSLVLLEIENKSLLFLPDSIISITGTWHKVDKSSCDEKSVESGSPNSLALVTNNGLDNSEFIYFLELQGSLDCPKRYYHKEQEESLSKCQIINERVKDNIFEEKVNVYPNPAPNEGFVYVDLTETDFDYNGVSIYDMYGRLIYVKSLSSNSLNKIKIDLENGVFLLRIFDQAGHSINKFIQVLK